MKIFKNISVIIILCATNSLFTARRATVDTPTASQATSVETPAQKRTLKRREKASTVPIITPQPMYQQQTYSSLLNQIKNQTNVIDNQNRLTPTFIQFIQNNANVSHLSPTEIEALLQAGVNIHSKWTGIAQQDRINLENFSLQVQNTLNAITLPLSFEEEKPSQPLPKPTPQYPIQQPTQPIKYPLTEETPIKTETPLQLPIKEQEIINQPIKIQPIVVEKEKAILTPVKPQDNRIFTIGNLINSSSSLLIRAYNQKSLENAKKEFLSSNIISNTKEALGNSENVKELLTTELSRQYGDKLGSGITIKQMVEDLWEEKVAMPTIEQPIVLKKNIIEIVKNNMMKIESAFNKKEMGDVVKVLSEANVVQQVKALNNSNEAKALLIEELQLINYSNTIESEPKTTVTETVNYIWNLS